MNKLKASIAIATFKRNDLLKRCLDRLAPGMQTTSSTSYEVIVADDDPQRSAIPFLQENYPWVTIAYGPSEGPGGARNAAAAFARADLIIFVDDDCIPDHNWVQAYIDQFKENQVMIGKTTCNDGCTDPFDHAPLNLDGKENFSCNFAISRYHFQQLEGFDQGYRIYGFEDYDFFTRCDKALLNRVFVPEAIVDHPPRRNARASRRILAKINQYRYMLKFGQSPSLSEGIRINLGFAKESLRRPAPLSRKLIFALDLAWYLILLVCYHERFIKQARQTLPPEVTL